MMDPTQDALIARTIDHYSASADSFREGTKDHDVDQNRAALLDELEGPAPHVILDLGCGNGAIARAIAPTAVQVMGVDRRPRCCAPRASCRVPPPPISLGWNRLRNSSS